MLHSVYILILRQILIILVVNILQSVIKDKYYRFKNIEAFITREGLIRKEKGFYDEGQTSVSRSLLFLLPSNICGSKENKISKPARQPTLMFLMELTTNPVDLQ